MLCVRRFMLSAALRNSCHRSDPSRTAQSSGYRSASSGNVAEAQNVVFFLGAAGSGKGTQCKRLTARSSNYIHYSAGELIRTERDTPGSSYGDIIRETIKVPGRYVPAKITCALLDRAMEIHTEPTVTFLIDGFPANQDNLTTWQELLQPKYPLQAVIFLDIPEEVSVQRGLGRGRGDDFEEGLRIRFRSYISQTLPIVEHYESLGVLHRIDGRETEEEITEEILRALHGKRIG